MLNQAYKRLNITLPHQTVLLIQKAAKPGQRSQLIDSAIRFYIDKVSRQKIRYGLRRGALQRAKLDLALAQDWFNGEEELWSQDK